MTAALDGGRLPVHIRWSLALRGGRIIEICFVPPCDAREALRRIPDAVRAWPARPRPRRTTPAQPASR